MVEEGEPLPSFELKGQDEGTVSSDSIRDALVYFYPKADTPGCTKEACNFRDSIKELEAAGIDVYGVSTDKVAAVKKFHEKYDLNFDLLADPEGEVAEKFGVLKDTGRAERTTFLVRDGVIEKVFRKVSPSKHIEEVLDYLSN